jgi:hypothetical protein
MFERVGVDQGRHAAQEAADAIEPADLDLVRKLAAIEAFAGGNRETAREGARRVVAMAKAAGYRARGAEPAVEDGIAVRGSVADLEREIGATLAEHESELRVARSSSPAP